MKLIAAVLAAAAIGANASCPNMCSGHGSCTTDDQCRCWKGYAGYDCSGRSCPVVESWANNHAEGLHTYSECAGAGICDRSSGECACFPGFEGRGCERSSCANGCSGNGICRTGDDLPDYVNGGANVPLTMSWDEKAISACVCDGGFSGADCSQRVCPFGDDPMTVCEEGNTEQIQQVTVGWPADFSTPGAAVDDVKLVNTDFALRFTSYSGETFYTDAFTGLSGGGDMAAASPVSETAGMTTALEALPNSRVKDVTVTAVVAVQNAASLDNAWKVTFHHEDSGNSYGKQEALQCPHTRKVATSGYDTFGCGAAGCQPRIKQPYGMMMMQGDESTDVTIVATGAYTFLVEPADLGTLWASSDAELGNAVNAKPFVKFTDDSVLTCPAATCPAATAAPAGWVAVQALRKGAASFALFVQGGAGAVGDATLHVAADAGGASANWVFMGFYEDLEASKELDIGAIMPDTRIALSTALASMTEFDADEKAMVAVMQFFPPTCTDGADVTNGANDGFLNKDVENIECAGRGECDRSSGMCSCFSGYHGNNCGKQTVLV